MTHRFVYSPLTFLTSVIVVLFGSTAHAATTCTQDSDCSHGYTCQVVGETACPAYACAPNTYCPPSTCTSTTYSQCMPGPCTTDGDCAADMVCFSQTYQSCPAVVSPDCPPGETCPVYSYDSGACTSQTASSCMPKYLLPCTADADCGTGFTCVKDPDVTTCSGGTPKPNPNYDASPVAYEAGTCTTTPSTTSHCEVQNITCTTVADCPTDWSCQTISSGGSGCAVGGRTTDGGTVTTISTCDAGAPTTTTTTQQCEPPYYGVYYGGSYLSVGDTTSGRASSAPQSATNGSGGSGTADTGTGGSTADAAPLGSGGASGSTADAGATGKSSSNGGCQCEIGIINPAAGRGATGASLLALLGLFGVVRRRRARI